MPNLLLVMLGGAIGAGTRHLVGRGFLAVAGPGFPWGTLTINVTGGLLMGVLVGVIARTGAAEGWRLFLAVGVLGGYTTFSSFALDAVLLAQRGAWAPALGYVLSSTVGAILALAAGLAAVRSVG